MNKIATVAKGKISLGAAFGLLLAKAFDPADAARVFRQISMLDQHLADRAAQHICSSPEEYPIKVVCLASDFLGQDKRRSILVREKGLKDLFRQVGSNARVHITFSKCTLALRGILKMDKAITMSRDARRHLIHAAYTEDGWKGLGCEYVMDLHLPNKHQMKRCARLLSHVAERVEIISALPPLEETSPIKKMLTRPQFRGLFYVEEIFVQACIRAYQSAQVVTEQWANELSRLSGMEDVIKLINHKVGGGQVSYFIGQYVVLFNKMFATPDTILG